jgi:cytochrome d ubiquinol oxidase subunit II
VTALTLAVRGGHTGVSILAPVGLLGVLLALRQVAAHRRVRATFVASSVFVMGLIGTAAVTLYPYIVPAFPAGTGGLSIYDQAASPFTLGAFLIVAIAGLAAVIVYQIAAARSMVRRRGPSTFEPTVR